MILFLASLGNISPALYEAASLDGANKWETFFNITSVIKANDSIFDSYGVMAALNGFTEIYAMTDARGGPTFVDSTGLFMNQTLGAQK